MSSSQHCDRMEKELDFVSRDCELSPSSILQRKFSSFSEPQF